MCFNKSIFEGSVNATLVASFIFIGSPKARAKSLPEPEGITPRVVDDPATAWIARCTIPSPPATINLSAPWPTVCCKRDFVSSIDDGERIAQMVISKHEQAEWLEVNTLEKTERGGDGFGSTGIK